MAIFILEKQESRNVSRGDDGTWQAQRAFSVWDTTSPTTLDNNTDVINLFGTSSSDADPDTSLDLDKRMPQVGDLFPGFTDFRAVGWFINTAKNQGNLLWEVVWNYKLTGTLPPGDPGPLDIGYVEWNTNIQRRFMDAYRGAGPFDIALPPNGTVLGETEAAGSASDDISVHGEPLSILRLIQEVQITEIMEGTTLRNNINMYRSMVGTRNSAIFQGAGIGYVLYSGAKTTRVEINKFSVTHSFLYDAWYHLVQIAARDPENGRILMNTDKTAKPAKTVYWRQPFPDTADHNTLSTYF